MTSLKASLWLLAALTLSGLLLMGFYVPIAAPPIPPAPSAGVSAGHILRGVHFWAAQIIIFAVLAHLARTVFVKTNRKRTGWAICLLLLTCLLWFTGMLLPWDQLAFWMQRWMHGLSAQNALWTVYWTHTLALPALVLPFLLVYVRRTRRDMAASA